MARILMSLMLVVGLATGASAVNVFYTLTGDTTVLNTTTNPLVLPAAGSATLDVHLGAMVGEVGSVDLYIIEQDVSGLTFSAQAVNAGAGFSFAMFPGDGVTQDYLSGFALFGVTPGVIGTFTVTTAAAGSATLGSSPMTLIGDTIGTVLPFSVQQVAITPEPATLALLVMGGLAAIRRRR